MTDPVPYELYAIRYATATRNPADVFIGGDVHDGSIPMDYFVWVARNDRHTVVVDTGFGALAAQRRGRQLLREPGEGLRLLGVDCDQVEHVIITHLHYDHAGNLQLFPRARFHLQEREMSFATGRHMCHGFFSHAYDLEPVLSMVRLVYAAQVQFHNGDATIVPGITVHHVGGHTDGLQVVRVWTRLGWVVLASDAAHYLANMTSGTPLSHRGQCHADGHRLGAVTGTCDPTAIHCAGPRPAGDATLPGTLPGSAGRCRPARR